MTNRSGIELAFIPEITRVYTKTNTVFVNINATENAEVETHSIPICVSVGIERSSTGGTTRSSEQLFRRSVGKLYIRALSLL